MKNELDEILSIMKIPRSAHSRRCHDAVEYRYRMEREQKINEKKAKWDRCEAKSFAYIYVIETHFLFPEWSIWVDAFLLRSKSNVLFRGDGILGVHVPKSEVEELVSTYREFQKGYNDTDRICISHGRHGVYFVDEDGNTIHEKGMR